MIKLIEVTEGTDLILLKMIPVTVKMTHTKHFRMVFEGLGRIEFKDASIICKQKSTEGTRKKQRLFKFAVTESGV